MLLLESYLDAVDEQVVQYHSIARVGKELVFTIEGALGPLLPMQDFIANETVQKQFAEIYNPGDWSKVIENKASLNESHCHSPSTSCMNFDKIISSEPGLSMVAEKRIMAEAPYFPDHFPYKPVLPLTVLLECKLNLAKEFVAQAGFDKSYQVTELRKIKMNEFVQPGAVVLCYVKVKEHNEEQLVLTYKSEVDGKRVCVVEVVLLCQGKST
jgi:3-hydroxymyristoyl/3-hydroxydecanoyl-(acyl carrier protein) dehydratase